MQRVTAGFVAEASNLNMDTTWSTICPHDRAAFTEGLFYLNGFLYESTGQEMGRSWIRKVKLETGEVPAATCSGKVIMSPLAK